MATGGCRRAAPGQTPTVLADNGSGGRRHADRRHAVGGDPRSQWQGLQAKDHPHVRARARNLRLPAAWPPEGQLAQAIRHPGLRRGDASHRRLAVDRPQSPGPAPRDRAPSDRQRRADGRPVRPVEAAGRPQQPHPDRSARDGRGSDRCPAGGRAGILGARVLLPAFDAASSARYASTMSTSTPGSSASAAAGTTSKARSHRRRSPASATCR